MISKTSEYALSALVCLATQSERSLTAREIAQSTGMPEGYLAKVLRTLARLGIVRSRRGPAGGFTLSRSAEEMDLIDVIRSIEPRRQHPEAEGAGVLAALKNRIERAANAELACFSGVTLAELLPSESPT